MVDVVRADGAAEQPLQQIVLLVRALRRREHREAVGSVRVAELEHLRGREIERLVPCGLAERLVPTWRRGHTIARVAQRLVEQRELLEGIELRAALVRLRLLFDDHPRTVAASPLRDLLRRGLPRPLSVALLPSLADERLREPVAMHREIETETPLHARRPDVGRGLLDPRAAHPLNVVAAHLEIDLAADAAVRAHAAHLAHRLAQRLRAHLGERDDVVDRAGGAYAHALAAPRASRVIRVTICADDDLRVLAAIAGLEHAHHLNVLARANAARAQDARRHVVLDERVAFALVSGAQPEGRALVRGHVVSAHVFLELVARASHGDLFHRVALEEHAEHGPAVLDGGVRLGGDFLSVGRLRRARGDELGRAFDGDEADAAVADDGELRIPAQRRHLETQRAGGLENGGALRHRDFTSVDCKRRHVGRSLSDFGSGHALPSL